MRAFTPVPPETIERLVRQLLAGDRQFLLEQAKALQQAEWTFPEIAVELIEPVLDEIGQRWADRALTLGHEHLATALCQQVIASLRTELPVPDPATSPVAVVCCGPAERHSLGAEIVAGTLQSIGWFPLYLGADTPPEGVVAIVEEWMAGLVTFSVSTVAIVPGTAELVSWLKDRQPERRVVVGGQAAELRFFPEADLVVGRDLMELVRAAIVWRTAR